MLQSQTTYLIARAIPNWAYRFTAYIALWLVVALISSVYWKVYPAGGYPYTFLQLFATKATLWLTWGALAIVILSLSSRFCIVRPARLRRLSILFLLSGVITGTYVIFYVFLIHIVVGGGLGLPYFGATFRHVMTNHATFYYLAFWALVSVEHALLYYRDSHERQLRETRLSADLARAQLATLQSQLHPHFLFNALNAVSSLILTGDREEASDLITEISDLLRAGIELSDTPSVPLADELAFARRYLSLISARFPRKLETTFEIDDSIHEIAVPTMILQPLIENAVKFSGVTSGNPGTIKIGTKQDDGDLQLRIENSISIGDVLEQTGSGVGIENTRQRLAAVYGNKAEMKIDTDNSRFIVRISIPTGMKV